MSRTYYNTSDDIPKVEAAIKDAVHYHLWGLLFSEEETWEEARTKRFIKSNITESTDAAFFDSNHVNKVTNSPLPFLAWNIGDFSDRVKEYNHYSKNKKHYSIDFDCKIAVIPSYMEMTIIGFYEKYSDYLRAISKLQFDLASLTRITAPISINNIDTEFNFVLNLEKELAPGEYTGKFQTWLEKGKINDFVLKYKIQFPKIFVDSDIIGNIDIAEFYLKRLQDDSIIYQNLDVK